MRPHDIASGTVVRTVPGDKLGRVVDRGAKAFVVESTGPVARRVALPYGEIVSLRGGELWVLADPEDVDDVLGRDSASAKAPSEPEVAP